MLAGILLKLGGVGIARVLAFTSLDSRKVMELCKSLGIWGGVLAGLVCLRETDLKRLVAYSSVRHIRFVVVGLLRIKELGWCGARILIISHGLRSSGMFFLVNTVYKKQGSRRILICGGLLRVLPGIAFWWFVGTIFSGGCPPSASLVREILVVCRRIGDRGLVVGSMGLVIFLRIAYGFYLYGRVSHGRVSGRVGPFVGSDIMRKLVCFLHFIPLVMLTLSIERLRALG